MNYTGPLSERTTHRPPDRPHALPRASRSSAAANCEPEPCWGSGGKTSRDNREEPQPDFPRSRQRRAFARLPRTDWVGMTEERLSWRALVIAQGTGPAPEWIALAPCGVPATGQAREC